MTSLSKKLTVAFLALAATVCLAFGLLFNVPKIALAAEDPQVVEITDADCYEISDNRLTGLSQKGIAAVGNGNFTLTIPSTVKTIAAGSSSQSILGTLTTKLKGVKIPASVTEIGANAFYGCVAVAEIDLSEATGLTKIGANAFDAGLTGGALSGNHLTSITVPEGVVSVGDRAFANHTGLTEINFYATACSDFAAQDNNPFYKAGYANKVAEKSLTVNIGKAGGAAVSKIPANFLYSAAAYTHKVTAVNFANVDTTAEGGSFGDYAFARSQSLTSVTFGTAKLGAIGKYAFQSCPALKTTDAIPATVTAINEGAFKGCTSLETVLLASGSALETIDKDAFNGCTAVKSVSNLPASLKTIGENAFYGCSSLPDITFVAGSALTSVGRGAFQNCTALSRVTVGSRTDKTLELPAGVTTIGSNAFTGCAFETITVNENVTTIGAAAFSNCTAVKKINYYAKQANANTSSPFAGSGNGADVVIGQAGSGKQVTLLPAKLFASTAIHTVSFVNVNFTVTGFGADAFYNCTSLKSVTFDANSHINTIPTNAFNGCSVLSDIELPTTLGIREIGESAFFDCPSLYKFTIPADLETISANAFGGKTRVLEVKNLSSLEIKADQTNGSVGLYALNVYSSGDGKLVEQDGYIFISATEGGSTVTYLVKYTGEASIITLPEYNSSYDYKIYGRAFAGNTVITAVTVPNGITALGDEVFSGCTSLGSITLPDSIIEIGDSTFRECTALTEVKLPAYLGEIGSYMFGGCTALESIAIPASVNTIQDSAFRGCTSLASVEFAANSSLKKIEQSAFENCVSLTVFETPVSVDGIGAYAFKGCTALKTFYLPKALNNYNVNVFADVTNCLLIAPDKDAYNTYINSNFRTFILTYEVTINLVYGEFDGSTEDKTKTTLKLFGRDYRYEKNEDNSWTINPNGGMPVQDGYSKSVWYEDADFNTKVTDVTFNTMLENPGWDATLYAQVLEIPQLTPKTGLIYSGDGSGAGGVFAFDKVFNETIDSKFSLSIIDYNLVSGAAGPVPTEIRDAGLYTIKISIADADTYGQWEDLDTAKIEVTIGRSAAFIGDNWIIEGGSSLQHQTEIRKLYVYQGASGEVPFDEEQENMTPAQERPVRDVLASYVYASASKTTIVLNKSGVDAARYTIDEDSYTGNSYKDAGVYYASVTVRVGNNYMLSIASGDDSVSRGIGCVQNPDSSYTLSKVWYIVNSGTAQLLSKDNTAYTVTDWTYRELKTAEQLPGAPTYTDASKSLTFSLSRTNDDSSSLTSEVIVADKPVTDAEFESLFNESMPAGNYVLTVNVKNSDGSVYYAYTFNFNVLPADLSSLLSGKGGSVDSWWEPLPNGTEERHWLQRNNFRVKNDNKVHLDDGTPKLYILGLSPKTIHPRNGIWGQNNYDKYFTDCAITYNIVKSGATTGENRNYYTETEIRNSVSNPDRAMTVPNDMGLYTVYYNISASNYKPLVDVTNDSVRKQYYYTLVIFGELTVPRVDAQVYDGTARSFNVSSDYYEAVLLDGKTQASRTALEAIGCGTYNYTDAGTHMIALKIRASYADSGVCQWASGITTYQNTYATVNVTINRAKNATTQPLYMTSWVWGNYDAMANKPSWGTQFAAAQTFTLTNLATGKIYTYNGTEEGTDFGSADAGKYKLTATAVGGVGYNWEAFTTTIDEVIIGKANVYWDEVPYIESWRYGDYKNMFVEPRPEIHESFKALESSVEKYYCLASDLDNANAEKYASLDDLLKKLNTNEVPAGRYVLVYNLEEGVNYEEWFYPVYFSVLKAENYWDTTPVVQGWRYGEFEERGADPAAVPHFSGKVVFSYQQINEQGQPIGASYATIKDMLNAIGDANGELPVGNYRLTVSVAGTANYEAMREMTLTFAVSKTENSWVDIPNIIGWSEGGYAAADNAPVAKARFGNVYFTIKDANGNEIISRVSADDVNAAKLKALGVGNYILIAEVDESANYNALRDEAYFAVFEDSVGMTGLIAATIVFAVIAVGLAVAGAILLIRRNKKLEADFRNMVKSELNRR